MFNHIHCFSNKPHRNFCSGLHIFFQIHHSDALPKFICFNCWEKTEEFHQFHRSVHDAQNEYLKRITNFEMENENENENNSHEIMTQPNFVEVITNCDGFDEFADENLIKLNHENEDSEYQSGMQPIDVFYNETTISDDNEIFQQAEDKSGNIFTNHLKFKMNLCISIDYSNMFHII